MKGINIDEANKLVINPMQIDVDRFVVTEAKTQATSTQEFTYVEPVEFGTGCFGNPDAFNRLQEIMHQRDNTNQISAEVELVDVPNTLDVMENSLETNFSPIQNGDNGAEPVFC